MNETILRRCLGHALWRRLTAWISLSPIGSRRERGLVSGLGPTYKRDGHAGLMYVN